MTRFTDSPYERMMTRRPEGGKETSRPPSLPHSHPCYGCGNYGSPCVGICHREMERWLKEKQSAPALYGGHPIVRDVPISPLFGKQHYAHLYAEAGRHFGSRIQ